MARRESHQPRERGTNGFPDKICARCGRPFSWRKKWARDWEQVRYCSDKCRMGKSAAATPT
jgi:hypothetical protein